MTKLARITGKLFGGSASASGTDPEIAQFGSGKTGTYLGTTDVNTIQSLAAWQNGFIGCVTPTDQFPPLPEMTGFGKVLSYIQCYLLQQGVPEWDSGTTYYTGNWCSSNGNLYVSLADENLNNAVTDPAYWSKFTGGTFTRNFGEIVTSSLPLTDATLHLADGSLLSYNDYPEFINYIDSIYTGDTGVFTTEANWQSSFSTYGECGKYVYNSVNKQVRLPLYASVFKNVSNTANVGNITAAGIPAHSHTATTSGAGDHTHTIESAGSHTHTIESAGSHTHTLEANGTHTHTAANNGSHTHTLDSAGAHTHSRGTQDITGTFSGVGQAYNSSVTSATLSGAFYRVNTSNNPEQGVKLNNASNNERDDYFGFQASKNWTGETSTAGAHTHTVSSAGSHTHTIENAGSHTHTAASNGAHVHTAVSNGAHIHYNELNGAHIHNVTVYSGGAIGSATTVQVQSINQLVYIVVAK